MIHKIIISGNPIPKKRPKFARRGNFVTVYDTQKKESDSIKLEILSQWNQKPIDTAIEMEIIFYMPIPDSWSKKRKEAALASKHISKPDIDNTLKKYLDDMNSIVYLDDRLIYKLSAEKRYDLIPRTEITIKELSDQQKSPSL